jgi:hypothetical protein
MLNRGRSQIDVAICAGWTVAPAPRVSASAGVRPRAQTHLLHTCTALHQTQCGARCRRAQHLRCASRSRPPGSGRAPGSVPSRRWWSGWRPGRPLRWRTMPIAAPAPPRRGPEWPPTARRGARLITSGTGHARDFHVDVDAVEQRAGEPLLVAADDHRAARAGVFRVAPVATGTPVQFFA